MRLQHTTLIEHLELLADAIENKLALPSVLLHDRLAGVVVALERAPTVFGTAVPAPVCDALQQALGELDATASAAATAPATASAAATLARAFRAAFASWLVAVPNGDRASLCALAHEWLRVLRDEQVGRGAAPTSALVMSTHTHARAQPVETFEVAPATRFGVFLFLSFFLSLSRELTRCALDAQRSLVERRILRASQRFRRLVLLVRLFIGRSLAGRRDSDRVHVAIRRAVVRVPSADCRRASDAAADAGAVCCACARLRL